MTDQQCSCMQFTYFTVSGVVFSFLTVVLITSFKLLVKLFHIFKDSADFCFSYILKEIQICSNQWFFN